MTISPLPPMEGPVCPLPLRHDQTVVMGHGSGGRMTHELIQNTFLPHLSSPWNTGNDFAALPLSQESNVPAGLVVSTDSHIVSPLFFPGGDIGRLAVCGTVNDISMSGATPLYLTAGFILEEGLPISMLEKILASMKIAADEAGVQVVAGDTKVVEKGKGDGIFITTTGVGLKDPRYHPAGQSAVPGDVVLISGALGDHAMAVLSARGDLGFETNIQSDVAPLNSMIHELLSAAPHTHVLRDPTRGGLATSLNEIAAQSKVNITIFEKDIPVHTPVQAVCEMLGFDPLYAANEGKLIVIVPPDEADAALASLRSHPYGREARMIGEVLPNPKNRVLLKTRIGGSRILDMLAGEMLPRIC